MEISLLEKELSSKDDRRGIFKQEFILIKEDVPEMERIC